MASLQLAPVKAEDQTIGNSASAICSEPWPLVRMNDCPSMFFTSRRYLRLWLEQNHRKHSPIWLQYKKMAAILSSGDKEAVTYDDLVEEALCYGWIDGRRRKVDEARTSLYYCPRRKGSMWSDLNKKRIAALEKKGLLAPAGIEKIRASKEDGSWYKAYPTAPAKGGLS